MKKTTTKRNSHQMFNDESGKVIFLEVDLHMKNICKLFQENNITFGEADRNSIILKRHAGARCAIISFRSARKDDILKNTEVLKKLYPSLKEESRQWVDSFFSKNGVVSLPQGVAEKTTTFREIVKICLGR